MNIKQLIERLNLLDPELEVEVAMSPRPDEWYQVDSVEKTSNYKGNDVAVINTD